MFCPQCGTELPDEANFCTDCGTQIESRAAEPSPRPADDGEPILTVRPVFIPWVTLAKVLPFQLFGTAWGAGFLGGFSMVGLRGLGLSFPTWAPFVFWGALAFVGIPLVAYLLKKHTYEFTEYNFYRDRLEYTEGYLQAEDKRVRYDNVVEASMKRGIIQKRYGLGTITLKTPGTTYSRDTFTSSGIKLADIPEPEKVYDTIQDIAGV